nr:uncharacterized protein LOC129387059 [Dermacentor andersoni]
MASNLLRDCHCAAAVLHEQKVTKTKMASATAGRAGVSREETSRVSFTREETTAFLALISEMNISELLDSRRQRNQAHFQIIEAEMAELGYCWSWQQLRTHWKNLKARYNKELHEQNKSGASRSAWQWFTEMQALLSHRPMSEALSNGVDSVNNEECGESITGSKPADDMSESLDDSPNPCLVSLQRRRSKSKYAELVEVLADHQKKKMQSCSKNTQR